MLPEVINLVNNVEDVWDELVVEEAVHVGQELLQLGVRMTKWDEDTQGVNGPRLAAPARVLAHILVVKVVREAVAYVAKQQLPIWI